MVSPNTHRQELFENGALVESLEIREAPPGTFTTTRKDAGGGQIEQRPSTTGEVDGLVVRQDRTSRLAAEQAVKDIDPAAITTFAAARVAIAALQDLMLRTSITSDD